MSNNKIGEYFMGNENTISRIEQVEIRKVWQNEARDFSTWLEDNIDILNEEITISIVPDSIRREESAGMFSADIVAEDEDGQRVVIENQLGKSDHDHLGKVITYATALEAKVVIWIVGTPRPEHVKSVAWLNDSTPLTAYMFQIQAVRIDNSNVAAHMTLIVGPSVSAKNNMAAIQGITEEGRERLKFFTQLLTHANNETKLHSGNSPTTRTHITSVAGHKGTYLRYWIAKNKTSVDLWIDREEGWEEWNEAVFESLKQEKAEIESGLGEPIIWHEAPRGRRLISQLDLGGLDDKEEWDVIIKGTVNQMIKFEAAISPHLQEAVMRADAIATAHENDH